MKFKKQNRRRQDKWNLYIRIAEMTLSAAVILLFLIYLLDTLNIPSKLGIVDADNSKDWLNYSIEYFGTIMASFIGFIGAIMAVALTLEKQNEFRKEDSRKNVLPLVKIRHAVHSYEDSSPFPPIIDGLKKSQTLLLIPICFENIGQREMYDIWIGGICYEKKISNSYYKVLPILYKNDTYNECLTSAIGCSNENFIEIRFKIFFKDCYDNWYYQEISGYGGGNKKTNYTINNLQIKSAPILVAEDDLPDKIKQTS